MLKWSDDVNEIELQQSLLWAALVGSSPAWMEDSESSVGFIVKTLTANLEYTLTNRQKCYMCKKFCLII